MPQFAVSTLIERAKSAADMTDDFVSPTEWLRWFNVEQAALEAVIARAGYVLRESYDNLLTDGASSLYTMTKTPIAIIGVYQVENQRYRRLRSEDVIDSKALRDTATLGSATHYRVTYFSGSDFPSVTLYPLPPSGETYQVVLIEAPTQTSDVDTTVYYPLGWEERIVLGMARRALAKEETISPALEAEIKRIDDHIEETAWNRLFASSGARVRNVDKVERGWTVAPTIPTRENWYFI